MRTKLLMFFVMCLLVVSIGLVGCTPSAPQTVTLKAISSWPSNMGNMTKFNEWVKKANEASQGKFKIEYIGGPENIPYNEQVGALKRGVVDLVQTAGGYYMGDIPEVFSLVLSQLNPVEERKSGFYNLLNEVHKKHGLFLMGRTQAYIPLAYFCFNVDAKGPKDLEGLKFRSNPPYDPLLKEMKIVPVTMGEPEIFTAMQQKVVDGFLKNISTGFVNVGLEKVTKYILNIGLWQSPTVVVFNLDSWNKLPADARKILSDTFLQMEANQMSFWAEQNNAELKKAADAGVILKEWSAADTKWLIDAAFRTGWDATLPKCPEYGPKLKELSMKK